MTPSPPVLEAEAAPKSSPRPVSMRHVLFVSFPGQGHVNPHLRLAKRVAAKGLLVTFSCTDDIGTKIQAASNILPGQQVPVGQGKLRFEFFNDGIPIDDPRRLDLAQLTHQQRTGGAASFRELVRRLNAEVAPVCFIVNNPFIPWVVDIAKDLGVPCAVLWVQSCAVFSAYHYYSVSPEIFPEDENSKVTLRLPGVPPLAAGDVPSFLLRTSAYKALAEVILEQFKNISGASWVFANTFMELEPEAIAAIREHTSLNIISVGPLIEPVEESPENQVKADMWKPVVDCIDWLDQQQPRTVVYVSVGSVVVLSDVEVAEVAAGLRETGRQFLWVLREEYQKLLPTRFKEETAEQGRVVAWSPQERVLAHRALACFVTHCGWNSTLETLSSGVPVVAWPQWGDQMPDAKFLVEVYKIGVRLWAPVKREEMKRCVEEVVAGPKAEGMRKRAEKWKEAAKKAVAPGGSSDQNIQAFVDQIVGKNRGVDEPEI